MHEGAGWRGVGTGRALLCCLLLLLLPGLQQSLHHQLGAILLVQGPEILIFQGAPVAKDGQPGAGRWPHRGAELSSLELGPGCPEGRGSLGRCLLYCHSEQTGGHCLPSQVPLSAPFSPSSPDAPLAPGSGDEVHAGWGPLQCCRVSELSLRSQTQLSCSSHSDGRPRR